ncbi:hypothetical protein, conserved [Babesia bigemina]|uniref:C3H1-type domain-containing protein n=1 Tax=Babesia bigemina TaxID=5866 RepID=A0A061BKE0_BABBI|nr:hypothetical protein, conserved [Babesia bigemina]CDR71907.1 hypothetical protein, conserved [Babesia bigemina]|eukprot:XP_012770849.1 hypothetical protein, conserved [Babesia bigemina]
MPTIHSLTMLLKKPWMALTPSSLALLGGFVGESESVKKAVIYAIIAVINSNEELKNDYSSLVTNLSESVNSAGQADDTGEIGQLKQKVDEEIAKISAEIEHLEKQIKLQNPSPPSPSPSADSAKLRSKLEALEKVEKLCDFYTNFNNPQNDPKNLLVNLCDGLQTFLGFSSDSKGYTGSGIVYSDLDRLCDGLMGFLSGVLSNIQDHLGQHKNEISEAIDTLNKNKHAGKKGFNDAIVKVVAGVRGYNEKVKRSNEDIKNPIRTLLRQIGEKGELYKGLNALQVPDALHQAEEAATKAEKLVETYIQTSKKFETEHKCTTKHISDLNSNCQTNVNHAYKNVMYETKRLEELSAKELQDMREMLSLITSTLDGLRDNIIAQINTHINELVNNLKGLVQNTILNPLNDINEKLKEYIQTLRKWIEKTNIDIDFTLKIVEKILNEVNSTGGADKLQRLEEAIQLIETELQSKVAELDTWKQAAGSAVSAAKEKCKTIGEMVETTGNTDDKIHGLAKDMQTKAEKLRVAAKEVKDNIEGWVKSALTQVKDMDEALKRDLKRIKDKIKEEFWKEVERLKTNEHIDELDERVREGLGLLENGIRLKLKEHVKNVLKSIETQVGNINGNAGLDGFVKHIENQYATRYAGKAFASIVDGWLDDILGKGNNIGIGSVKKWIELYVDARNNVDTVKAALKQQITLKISTGVIDIAQKKIEQVKSGINDNVAAVKDACETFASQLENKMKAGKGINFFVKEINEAIEKDPSTGTGNATYNANLTLSIHATLIALLSKANQVAKELGLFADLNGIRRDTPAIKKVDDAYRAAETLKSNLNVATAVEGSGTYSPSSQITLSTYKVDSQIEEQIHQAISEPSREPHVPKSKDYTLGKGLMDAFYEADQKLKHIVTKKQGLDLKVTEALNTQLGNDDENSRQEGGLVGTETRISLPTTNKRFEGYNTYVAQTKEAQLALASGDINTITAATGTLPNTIKEIEAEVKGKFTKGTLASEIDDPNTFQSPFTQITDQLNKIAGLVDSATKTKTLVGGGKDSKDGVQQYLDAINDMRTSATTVNFTAKDLDSHRNVQGLEKIKNEIQKLKDTNVDDVKDKLGALCEAIRTSAREVKSDLKRLQKNNLTYELEELKENIYKLQLKLQRGPLKEAKDFIDKHADVFKKQCIDTLTKHVNEQVKEASEKLTYQARKQYISSVKSMLEAFVGKVDVELKTVLREINHDVHMSHKKFMNSIGETFISKVKAINDVDPKDFDARKSPLSSAAGILNDALQSLLKELKQQKDFAPDIRKIDPSTTALQTVLEKLVKSKHFDSEFRDNLGVLKNAVSAFNPQAYGEGECPPILDALRNAFPLLAKELDKTYVNTYADLQFTDELMEGEKTITKYGKRCAKVCVTLLPSLYDYFTKLKEVCKSSLNTTVCKFSKRNDPISIGNFLTTSGYDVAENEESKDGELKRPSVYFTGQHIYDKIFETKYQGSNTIPHLKTCLSNTRKKLDSFDILDILECLIHHIDKYNEVSHIAAASSTKIPSSIYDMLVWCSGLPYNTVYPTILHETLVDMLSDPNKQKPDVHNGLELTVVNQQTQYLDAHPIKITYDDVVSALDHLCSKSHDVLTRIVGYGDAGSVYGSDFCNNSFNLHYPSNAAACFDLLLDILRRLFSTLTFLCQLCSLDANHHGWSDCQYGKEFSYGNRDCDQHTGETADCPPGSPLMLYLTDGLRGYLPHQISNVGCKPKCNTCPKSTPGMPCLTPLGFRGFSGSTKKGRSICDMIREFISHDYLAALLCMLPKAPSTLPEHYSFVLSLSNGISVPKSKKHDGTVTLNEALESSIDSISMSLYTQPNHFTDTLRKAYGDGKANHTWPHPAASNADLASLSMKQSCMLPKKERIHCAPYLLSLSSNTYKYLPQRHVDHYLSCAVYLPWSLYEYLQNLLQAFENISCRDWGCSHCMHSDKCRKGKHGADYGCRCWSAVKCRGVLGVFYTFGFVFKDAEKLLDENEQRYCHDFYNQLSNVLKSQYFQDLFKECDNFLYQIRFPFMTLTLALWLLSLLYLIHIMVIRLDLLHIKSHLRSPSSHRIAAQSLLAAARVNKLGRVFYLQP